MRRRLLHECRAPNMDVLNLRWVAVKANFGPLLTGLHPLAARVQRPGAINGALRPACESHRTKATAHDAHEE